MAGRQLQEVGGKDGGVGGGGAHGDYRVLHHLETGGEHISGVFGCY